MILRPAFGALAFDVAIGEEHVLHGIVELLDSPLVYELCTIQAPIDVLRQLRVLRRVRRIPVVELDVETLEILRALSSDASDELLGRHAFGFRLEHDRRAVRVVGAHEMNFVPLHPLETHPDIGLDVFHNMTDME